ncbi:DMT family transporter [Galactobacter caseinivorans]|uniref:DMT family transporter n=1 Tax=Galactobacter caseinivorans TaxID=2676123 RepID=UPI0018F646B5|nr:DMT family transporter [Galactobacter caseinivorans]
MAPHISAPARSALPLPLGLILALIAGVAMPAQGRTNSQLGARLGDGLAAALISFSVGLVIILLIAAILPAGRRSVRAIPATLRARVFPWWYMLAGAIGAYFVLSQGLVVGVIGIAVFTVANVTGQSLGGMVVDATGFGPGGRRPVTGVRIIGVAIMLGAVVWAVSPKLGEALHHPAQLLLPMLLPLTAGILNGFQTAMNGTQTKHYGNFIPATVFNFVAGTVVLGIAFAIKLGIAGPAGPLPHEPWLYLGGAMGVVFIGLSAYLARHLGVLLTSLGMIAGQLLGSLLLDAVWPSDAAGIALPTVLGSLLAIGAVCLASIQPGATMPWERKRG